MKVAIPANAWVEIEDDASLLENLFSRFGVARRRCHSLRHKYELKGLMTEGEIVKQVCEDTALNTRYVKDAYNTIKPLPQHITFGGKRNRELRAKNKISKEEYKRRRNSLLYSRGDKTKKGNPNIRIVEIASKKYLRVNVGDKKWVFLRFFIPEKYLQKYGRYLDGNHAYTVVMKRRENCDYDKFDVHIIIEVEEETKEGERIMSLDVNASHIDFAVLDKETKDVVTVGRINTSELQNTRRKKRENQVKKVAHKVKNIAKHFNADVVVGKLNTSDFKGNKKSNRKIHQMPQYKLRHWIKHICSKDGVKCEEKSEKDTSKYGKILSRHLGLDVHKCAAILFALRTLCYPLFRSFCSYLNLLSEVPSDDPDGRLRRKRRRGGPLTEARQSDDDKMRMKFCRGMKRSRRYPEIPGIGGLLLCRFKASLPYQTMNVRIW